MKPFRLPLSVTSYLLTMSAWLSDRLVGFPDLAQADNLTKSSLWGATIQEQIRLSQGYTYRGCLFGDSISSGLGNCLGEGTFNFAIGGLSSISLIEQLKLLNGSGLRCEHAVIAIGTNDAMYGTQDRIFVENLTQILNLVRAMGSTRIALVAAFYATIAASRNPWQAGSNQRVAEINGLIQQVALAEEVPFILDALQPLFVGDTLNQEVTQDGVHFNEKGLKIFQQVVMDILNSNP
jgi:lysophospholipase L1-like esterase